MILTPPSSDTQHLCGKRLYLSPISLRLSSVPSVLNLFSSSSPSVPTCYTATPALYSSHGESPPAHSTPLETSTHRVPFNRRDHPGHRRQTKTQTPTRKFLRSNPSHLSHRSKMGRSHPGSPSRTRRRKSPRNPHRPAKPHLPPPRHRPRHRTRNPQHHRKKSRPPLRPLRLHRRRCRIHGPGLAAQNRPHLRRRRLRLPNHRRPLRHQTKTLRTPRQRFPPFQRALASRLPPRRLLGRGRRSRSPHLRRRFFPRNAHP